MVKMKKPILYLALASLLFICCQSGNNKTTLEKDTTAMQIAIRHPELVDTLILATVAFKRGGLYNV